MLRACILALLFPCTLPALAAQPAEVAISAGYEEEAQQARLLLEKAVTAYRERGESVLAEINRQGQFTTSQHYVYVVNTQGTMLASGGPSAILIGRDISALLDEELKLAFQQVLSQPESGIVHSQQYRWMNWKDGQVERKHAYYQRVGDKIFAAGYYLPRSSPEEASNLLRDAVTAIGKNAQETLKRINQLDKLFNRDDLYVFVVDLEKEQFIAHGANLRLVGTNFRSLQAADGQPIGQQILSAIKGRQHAEVNYLWRNPITGKQESKATLLERVGQYIVAVGYYSPKQPAP
ncbi:cache domain-containing protein [Stutzerimonas stutzeri]|uniref:cache domain-containing protein n=1 Tax=Stutzerimonas stutzeri TaxID=316 RepID=UPI00244C5306|nr:cache domain-containing protein [Stutzerimonas stutzeri]MDH0426625.1 cache domain-containing protein [Stutzerimonas stutzeri]